MSDDAETRTIGVSLLARVEGEGALTLRFSGTEVTGVELRILEPPRLFEAFLRGRSASEAPDLTARICGICPIAYQMTACRAVEDALGLVLPDPLRALRRLVYCGEWIQSHALHIVMLHAPDFVGVDDVLELSRKYREEVKNGLSIKKAGNAIMETIGGRAVHPVNVRVGGFYRVPTKAELAVLRAELEPARDLACGLARWVSGFDYPDLWRDVELVALRDDAGYPIYEGRLVSTKGLDVDAAQFEASITEDQVPHSTALHARIVGRGAYVCGPLARFALNADRLRPIAGQVAALVGLTPDCRNPFRSILARAVEIVQALDDAIAIIDHYDPPAVPFVTAPWRRARGAAMTEAPRGVLYQRYELDAEGAIESARIVPPTSQNQRSIELDLVELGPRLAGLDDGAATRLAEHAIRNYDPCISCSTHFLKMRIEREEA